MSFKNKKDFNDWRRRYRENKTKEGKCNRCYRPLIEESGNKICINCSEAGAIRSTLSRSMKGM